MFMVPEMTKTPKKKPGRPPTGTNTPINVRLSPEELATLDAWIEREAKGIPTRPQAIRHLLVKALTKD
jgi:hypothetical protein